MAYLLVNPRLCADKLEMLSTSIGQISNSYWYYTELNSVHLSFVNPVGRTDGRPDGRTIDR